MENENGEDVVVDLSMDSSDQSNEVLDTGNSNHADNSTIDIASGDLSLSYNTKYTTSTVTSPLRNMKRSFDVAFLMAPDENLIKKQQQQQCSQFRVISTDLITKSLSPNSLETAVQSSDSECHIQENESEPVIHYDENPLIEHVGESVIASNTYLDNIEILPRYNSNLLTGIHQNRMGLLENTCLLIPKNNDNQRLDASEDDNNISGRRQDFNFDSVREHSENSEESASDKLNKAYNSEMYKLQNLCPTGCSPSGLISQSAFTKVSAPSNKIDSSRCIGTPIPVSPLSVSPLSTGGLSPDNLIYQESTSPSIKNGTDNSSFMQHFTQSTAKQFQNPVHFLLQRPHLTHFSIPQGGKSVATAYSSASLLLHQESCSKISRDSSITTNEGAITNGKYRSDFNNYLMKASFANSGKQLHQNTTDMEINPNFTNNINNSVKMRQNTMICHYRDSFTGHARLSAATYPFSPQALHASAADLVKRSPPPNILASVTNPVAASAIVSGSLIPPSFAALSLPIQNVCAKCNITFRMTSDLVYHMRSHHKNDNWNNDPFRRRREQDKLKCPVCSESFRERHHLTRHMTAHQDKEGDMMDEDPFREKVCSYSNDSVGRRKLISSIMIPQHSGNEK